MVKNDASVDFYRFVNSRDIRTHLESIGYVFSATEAACLVWRSMYATMEDKLNAWQYIIRNMPDCCIPERLNTVPQLSLHQFLRELLELQTSGRYVKFGEGSPAGSTTSCNEMTPRAYDLAHNVFDGMWFAFPTPFKRGDILVDTGLNGKIMVLDELAGATEDGREKLERFGDATNMTAYGYFVEPGSGEVYYECMHDYMRLEYFRSELTGHERVLYTVRTELMTGKETDQPESNSKERRTMENSVCFETSLHDIFSDLLSAPWQGKPIWEYIRAGELTAAPAFVGDLYHSAKTKIMFVGRDLNGWTEPIGDCSTLENTVQSITTQDAHHAFSTLVDRCGVPQSDGKKCYYHKNSRFFRLIKQVLEYFGESDIDTDATWYDDSKQWHQRFVWANLYCIGPRDPENMAASHFDAAAVKQSIDTYVKLMKLYIEHYQPDVVVFITDVPGWFVRWKRKNSFRSIVDEYSEDIEKPAEDVIVATGKIANSQIVVCKRPDKPGTPYHRVQMMAKTIYEHIQRTVS